MVQPKKHNNNNNKNLKKESAALSISGNLRGLLDLSFLVPDKLEGMWWRGALSL